MEVKLIFYFKKVKKKNQLISTKSRELLQGVKDKVSLTLNLVNSAQRPFGIFQLFLSELSKSVASQHRAALKETQTNRGRAPRLSPIP